MKFIDLKKQYRLYKKDIDSQIAGVIESTSFIMGPKVEEIERKLAEYVGVEHAVAVSSGTDALLVSLMALGVGPGDEVITTPFTFIATAEVITLLGAKPVLVDIDPLTYNIDPDKIGPAITDRTRAIMPVSIFGQCADFISINTIAGSHGLPVVEDGCQSFGATAGNRRSCGLSTIGCTSFFPSKPLGCYGDGGMIFTGDEGLADVMRQIREHGQDRRYHHVRIGINARLDALQAAVLLGKFPHFQNEVELRAAAAMAYERKLEGAPGVITPRVAEGNTHVYAQYSIQVDDRDALAASLDDKGIPTAVHYPVPIHLQPACASLGADEDSYPVATRVARHIISLPMHPFLTEEEIDEVVRAVISAVGA